MKHILIVLVFAFASSAAFANGGPGQEGNKPPRKIEKDRSETSLRETGKSAGGSGAGAEGN